MDRKAAESSPKSWVAALKWETRKELLVLSLTRPRLLLSRILRVKVEHRVKDMPTVILLGKEGNRLPFRGTGSIRSVNGQSRHQTC